VIVDTSAWIEYLRSTGSPVHLRLRQAAEAGDDILVPELVVMELLAGAIDERDARELRRLLHSFDVVPVAPLVDTEQAATLQRQCRRSGRTVRSMVDCMIAAVALRLGVPVLHLDQDFDVLASLTELDVVSLA
jgi:predicted nucleic acid-binding protein